MSIWILWRTVTRHRHTKTSSLTLESHTQWAGAFVAELSRFYPPNVGVVGPTCKEGNKKILTHDFVHKTHAYIFSVHYPPVLMDWWMDDWISATYGSANTRRLARVLVVHHLESTSDGEVPKPRDPRS